MKKILFLFFSLTFFAYGNEECLVTRAAFDVGSGTTRIKMATVDVCLNKINKVLLEDSKKVSYKEDLARSNSNEFSEQIQSAGIQALLELKAKAQEVAAKENISPVIYAGVATSAFRDIQNASSFTSKIYEQTEIKIMVISGEEEGSLGFLATSLLFPDIPKAQLLVWDIGAGSMQMTSLNSNNEFQIYMGNLASIPMKNYVIQNIKGGNLKTMASPNPIGPESMLKALNHVRESAQNEVPQNVKDKILNATIIGIGGVHYNSVQAQAAPNEREYTMAQVSEALQSRITLSDEELALLKNPDISSIDNPDKKQHELTKAKQYVDTDVTNLLLIYGFMSGLHIENVKTARITMADGILLNEKYWN